MKVILHVVHTNTTNCLYCHFCFSSGFSITHQALIIKYYCSMSTRNIILYKPKSKTHNTTFCF